VIDALLRDLGAAAIGSTFNQYRERGPDDVPDAPALRLANLRHYLAERDTADVVALGEAAGYQGMRWSGIAFTSERDLLRWGGPFQRTCRRERLWSEPSGTIVHSLLDRVDAERRVVLWNIVPTHPHRPGQVLSNRRPTVAEIAVGTSFARRLLAAFEPQLTIAIGRVAASVVGEDAAYVRHPANGGASAFTAGMTARLERPAGRLGSLQ
jgi:hypothetical protein